MGGVSNISLHSLPTMLDKVISFPSIIKHNLEKSVREGKSIALTPCICSFCGPSSLRKFHESFDQFSRSQQQPGQQLDARAPRTGSRESWKPQRESGQSGMAAWLWFLGAAGRLGLRFLVPVVCAVVSCSFKVGRLASNSLRFSSPENVLVSLSFLKGTVNWVWDSGLIFFSPLHIKNTCVTSSAFCGFWWEMLYYLNCFFTPVSNVSFFSGHFWDFLCL